MSCNGFDGISRNVVRALWGEDVVIGMRESGLRVFDYSGFAVFFFFFLLFDFHIFLKRVFCYIFGFFFLFFLRNNNSDV